MVLVRSNVAREELVNIATLAKLGIKPSLAVSLAQDPASEIDLYTSNGNLYIKKSALMAMQLFAKGRE